MTRTLPRAAAICSIVLASAAMALAGPLDASQVPADAKWLVHIDVSGAQQTTFAQQTAQESQVQDALGWIQERYGIDVGNDLTDATLFGLNYEPHTGVVLLDTSYDREKVIDVLNDEPSYKTTSYGDETLHSWTVTDKSAQPGDANRTYTMYAALQSGRIIMGRSEEQLKKTLDVLADKGESLEGKDSPLTAEVREGTFFRGAAIDLSGLKDRPGFQTLPQTEQITVVAGEEDGTFFLNSNLAAADAQTAQQIKNVIEGFRGMVALQTGQQNQEAAELANAIKVTVENDTNVTINWEVDSEKLLEVAQSAKQMANELQQQQKAPSAGRPQPPRN